MKTLLKIANKCLQSIGFIVLVGILFGFLSKTIFVSMTAKVPNVKNCDDAPDTYLNIMKKNIQNGADDSKDEFDILFTYWHQNAHPKGDLLPYALILANRDMCHEELYSINYYVYECIMGNESMMFLSDSLDTATFALANKYKNKAISNIKN